ncbi:glutamine amidotransferase [Gordonia alkanivorans CGMCC 6845]|uniref:Glutamine amidotransferase n=1 Tax=Gordonia alkanivorans CGMCC 6845 TaxID=1423140 RepID=W9DIR4_9ACTN|nr:glutamine amidotransferase [Gordonia alkanivorans CGMCC 6845]
MTQIAIVLYPRFTALDLIGPYEVLRMLPDAEVRFVTHEAGPVVADSGVLLIGATHSFDETPSPDLILVPGGPGCFGAAKDEKLLDWLRAVSPGAQWTTSVCTGSVVLAAAGLLDGLRATTHWSSLAALSLYGVTAVPDERIVRAGPDERIVTRPVSPPASTSRCGSPTRSPGRRRPRRSSSPSNTTRNRIWTPATGRRRRPARSRRRRCCSAAMSTSQRC